MSLPEYIVEDIAREAIKAVNNIGEGLHAIAAQMKRENERHEKKEEDE